jgi:glyoxylase-like metal-dependent hydrolase (beta-lactamase superfamily II)
MKILSHTGGLAMTNAFLVADETTGDCVLFDAPDHTVSPLVEQVQTRKWNLIGLWLTHGHFDHIADHAIVTQHFPAAKVLIHPLDEPKLQQPGVQSRMFQLPFTIPPRSADGYVNDGDELRIGNLRVKVLHTPGHAPGHVSFHFPDESVLIGGDLIIGGAIGRTDLPGADVHAMAQSVRRVMQLPGETVLLPGHGGQSTLADEKRENSYVRMILAGREIF